MYPPEHRRIGGTSLGFGDKFHFKSYPLILILIQDKTSLCLLTSLTNFLIFRPCLVQNRERPIELANVGYCDKMSAFKGYSLCEHCLHDLQFMKKGSSSPNLSKLAIADISCQFMKTRSLCRHCLQNKWTSPPQRLQYVSCTKKETKL